jgi:hypothetical protein
MYDIQHCFVWRPLRYHCVGGCWDRTQDTVATIRHRLSDALNHSAIYLIHKLTDSDQNGVLEETLRSGTDSYC